MSRPTPSGSTTYHRTSPTTTKTAAATALATPSRTFFAALARGLGVAGFGPADDPASLAAALREAIATVDAGLPALVEVRVAAGYTPAMASALTREA